MDYTGTGNSLNVRHPHALQLIMDSLRYWVLEMHVDGFRFDLASTLAREFYDVDRLVELLRARAAGPGGLAGEAHRRAVGRRPRRLPGGQLPAAVDGVERQVPRHRARLLARRAGDARRVRVAAHGFGRPLRALRAPAGRSINFVTAHDGFTLRDLVSYNEKHNEANGEDNNDGESHNRSWNSRRRGHRPTTPRCSTLRARQQRNFLATLLLSQGVPMLAARRRARPHAAAATTTPTRRTTSSAGSTGTQADQPLIEFTAALAQLRASIRRSGAAGSSTAARCVAESEGEPLPDIVWLRPDGSLMDPRTGSTGFGRAIGVFLNGEGIRRRDARGEPITDRTSSCSSTPRPSRSTSPCRGATAPSGTC